MSMRHPIDKRDFPPVLEFLEMLNDAGSYFFGCKLSMDMMWLTQGDLAPYAQVIGARELMYLSEGARLLFV